MRLMSLSATLLLFPFLALSATNAETYFKYGLGIGAPDSDTLGSIKTFGLGERHEVFGRFKLNTEVGLFSDPNQDKGRESAGYLKTQLGIEPTFGPAFIGAYWGIGGITNTDTLLSSYFEFFHDLEVGLRDSKTNTGVALVWQHISNAGISLPNRGRDFLCLKLLIGW